MEWSIKTIGGSALRVMRADAVVVGSGAAGFNAAEQLYRQGCRNVVLVTDGINRGTSRNTGSDKQTYYKLTLSGSEPDSVGEMARTLFEGRCVDGDIALAEAAGSPAAFFHLCGLGVPFPVNRFGEYVGYKTDHDPRRRATSVGPLTSRSMTEALERAVRACGIPILDGFLAVSILKSEGEVTGLLCLDQNAPDLEHAYAAICTANVVWATGGPAGIYADSAYPAAHCGMTGAALEAGAWGRNLTEWQYGLASLRPRWNVSGSYMQVLPRFLSTDADGTHPREFLRDFFPDTARMLSAVFLKGYQWPFDVCKVADGSSVIDLLVYIECFVKKRRVFLDYRENPGAQPVPFSELDPQARDYLERAGAAFGRPIERLMQLNAPAAEFYRSRGVDLAQEPLEIAVCAQHNNGGLDVDHWWQTAVGGLFAVGEAAGTHGVYRPGGSALNAGQVGSSRAARYICARRLFPADEAAFERACGPALDAQRSRAVQILSGGDTVGTLWRQAQERMSRIGGPIRELEQIDSGMAAVREDLAQFDQQVRAQGIRGLADACRYRDVLVCQQAYLGAMADYIRAGGRSRGSAMYCAPEGIHPWPELSERFSFLPDDRGLDGMVQLVRYGAEENTYAWRAVRPIPQEDDFFENVWREYRCDGNVR